MSKEQISNNYIELQKMYHGWKKTPLDRKIAITGAVSEKSIGNAIVGYFYEKYRINYFEKFNQNVISDEFDFHGFTDLVMCHGATSLNWIEDLNNSDINNIIDVNLYGSIRVFQQFVIDTIDAPYRKKIISIGSMAYRNVLNGSSIYCASKAGLNMFIRCAAWELAPKGFDVYIIHPSNVLDTPMTEQTIVQLMKYRDLTREESELYWGSNLPKESFLTKNEIAQHIDYLLMHENTEYLCGSPIEMAGGQR